MTYWNKQHYQPPKQVKKELTIDNFHEDVEACKFFTLIYLNEYCFDWDLKARFKFNAKNIEKYSTLLCDLGIIDYRLYSELDHIRQDVIRETTPDFDRFYKKNDTTYIQTEYCKTEGQDLFNLIIQTHKENRGFFNFITRVAELRKAFKLKIQEITEIEKNDDVRLINFRNGVIVEQDTHKKKLRDLELLKYSKVARLSHSSSNSLVVATQSELKTQLALIKKEENSNLLRTAQENNLESEVNCEKNKKLIKPIIYHNARNDPKNEKGQIFDFNIKDKSKKELKADYFGGYTNEDHTANIKKEMLNNTVSNNEFLEITDAKNKFKVKNKIVTSEDREKAYIERCRKNGIMKQSKSRVSVI